VRSGLSETRRIGSQKPPELQAPSLSKEKCPECGSDLLYKDGLRHLANGESIQRCLCRKCSYRFSHGLDHQNGSHHHDYREVLISSYNQTATRQVSALIKGAKNLDNATIEKVAGISPKIEQDIRGKIVQFAWNMQKDNYAKGTIMLYSRALTRLVKEKADIMNSDSVKEALARLEVSESRKHNIAAAYTLFLGMNGLTWKPPLEHITRKLPFIPNERELDDLIAGCGKKTTAYLQMLKETAMRMGEAARIKWENIDLERKTITLNDPEKNGNPRIFSVSNRLVNMLAALPRNTDYAWGTDSKITRGSVFYRERKKIAHKLANPRIMRIGLHSFRHWKATMLYHETKNPILVKEFLGHRTLDTTLLYIQTEKSLFRDENENFIVKAVKDAQEIHELLEVGFEYVCEKDGLMFFRKRK